jgi:translation initiation factor 4E
MAAGYLSFNKKVSPGLPKKHMPSGRDLDELQSKDPALSSAWMIWEQISIDAKAAQYSDATRKVASFGTVKEFWTYWNHMPQPSELVEGKRLVRETRGDSSSRSYVDAIMLFRDGVKPEWEDSTNALGGHFQFQLKPQLGGGCIDEYWNNIVLGMIGGSIEPADMITGVRLVDKMNTRAPSIRVEVWFSNYEDSDRVDNLQKNLEQAMTLRLDGTHSQAGAWGKTERKSHIQKK